MQTPQVWWYGTDTTGAPVEPTDAAGKTVWRAQRLAWGNLREETWLAEGADNCLRLPGQYEDRETGLFYNLHRYYDPRHGRYITPDPIGLKGGLNQYTYVPDPLKWIDPLGLCKGDIITYRGDNRRSPDEIFRDGFKPKGDSDDLFLHVLDSDNPPSNFISTTPDRNIATEFATSYGSKDGYVYYTRASNGIDINKALGADSPFTREAEIAVPGGIKPEDVLGATPVNADGSWGNFTILNPNRY